MVRQLWTDEKRRTLVCVDSYDDGILRGRFFSAYREMETFESLSQFLVRMESLLEAHKAPQAYTAARSFSAGLQREDAPTPSPRTPRGARATFELQILFRQHSSWQGLLLWKDKRKQQSFRSVLELVLLMDSALRTGKGCDTPQ